MSKRERIWKARQRLLFFVTRTSCPAHLKRPIRRTIARIEELAK